LTLKFRFSAHGYSIQDRRLDRILTTPDSLTASMERFPVMVRKLIQTNRHVKFFFIDISALDESC
jgi:hypothetical protein